MLESYATGLIGLTAVLALWVWVQTAWRRSFSGVSGDADVLAERIGCSGCERVEVCAQAATAEARDEEENP